MLRAAVVNIERKKRRLTRFLFFARCKGTADIDSIKRAFTEG